MLENLNLFLRQKNSIATAAVLLFLFANLFAVEPEAISGPDNLTAPIYVVIDSRSGSVILEQSSEVPIFPASLAKLMTLHLSLQDAESGKLSYEEVYPVPDGGLATSMRPGSSTIGLSKGDKATLITLQRAAGIASGNDAAWSLAILSEGNADRFINRMNREALKLGMTGTRYVDPDGWSSVSVTTAADQIRLSLNYLDSHPDVLDQIHSHTAMSYMEIDSIRNHSARRNTNLLLGRVEGVDGLKTGAIPGEGFHFLATAERGDTRFIVLVMGIRAKRYIDGLNTRAREAEELIEWAFRNYYTWKPVLPDPVTVPVRHGHRDSAELHITDLVRPMTLHLSADPIVMISNIPESLTAPVSSGSNLGWIRWYQNGELILERMLRTENNIDRKWRFRDIFR